MVYVNRRTWVDRKDNSRNFKGSVFVTFKDKASAEAFMALESVKNPEGEELVRKWQAEYFEEKRKHSLTYDYGRKFSNMPEIES